jgi:hypothetical protein
MISFRDTHGSSPIETFIEMVVILALAPVIVSCIVQGIITIVAIALPWLAVTLIVIGVAACFAAVLAAHRGAPRNMGPPPGGGVPLLPPLRRPPGIPGPPGEGRERQEH